MAQAITESKGLTTSKVKANASTIDRILEYAEFNRYGIYAVLLLFNMCLGGIAVGLGAMDSVVQLSILVVSAMTLLTFILAVQPMKVILSLAVIQAVLALGIIVSYLF